MRRQDLRGSWRRIRFEDGVGSGGLSFREFVRRRREFRTPPAGMAIGWRLA
jgi:hypothetical protein